MLAQIAKATREYLPAGAQEALRRKVGSLRRVQFNLCKLLICFQFLLSGKRGRHARRHRTSEGDADVIPDDSDEELDEAVRASADAAPMMRRPAKRARAAASR